MKILHLISSPRGNSSFSVKLGEEIVGRLQAKYPGSTIKTSNLAENPYPHIETTHMEAFGLPADQRNQAHQAAAAQSDAAIDDLLEADLIVIGVPMYNFGIPSTLKTWIDHVLRAGKTFRYDENGPEGLVKNKKVFLAISTGGVFSEGGRASLDFTEPYLRNVLGFAGMTDITVYRVEGIAVPQLQEKALEKAVGQIAV